MGKKTVFAFLLLIFLIGAAVVYYALRLKTAATLNPRGLIAGNERDIFVFALILGLLVVVPAILAVFFMVFHYRASNEKSKYTPDWENDKAIEIIWWLIPLTVVLILAGAMLKYTKMLDPFKPIASSKKPLTIQVIALEWKWLFIYPEQKIATVNFIEFPQNTPINFEITANAPMNSFWIPALGGQIYAMTGMSTQTHFIANKIGEYDGSDAEISGKGFAGMRFVAKSVTDEDFNSWVQKIKSANNPMSYSVYIELSKPSENNPRAFYFPVEDNLYNMVVASFYPFNSVDGAGH